MSNPWPLVRSVLSMGGANGWAQAEMVSPGEGNEARREGQREVLAPSLYRGSGGTCPTDPVEGRGASSHRTADGRHKGCYGIRGRVNETAADSAKAGV